LNKFPPPRVTYNLNPNVNYYPENYWNINLKTYINRDIFLTNNRAIGGIYFTHSNDKENAYEIVTRGKYLTIGEAGITNVGNRALAITGAGSVTSTSGVLSIKFTQSTRYRSTLESPIKDHKNHKVGVTIAGNHGGARDNILFSGRFSNTFTGRFIVSGNSIVLLNKHSGATAVSGDILVEKSAHLHLGGSEQIRDTSTIVLSSLNKANRSVFGYSAEGNTRISEKIHALVVDRFGEVNFDTNGKSSGLKYLYLDDLIIHDGGELIIKNWVENRDYLLVRKDSKNLESALKKIEFEGYDRKKIHKEDFNKDYWLISSAPEPSTYGALFAATGLGVSLSRRRNFTRCRSE